MIQVTDRDRAFVAVALPLALVALYAIFVHAPRARALAEMRSRLESLGDAEDLELERPALQRRRADAAARRAEADAAEAMRVAGGGEATAPGGDSARLDRVVAVLNATDGVKLTAAERIWQTGNGGEPRAKALVREALGDGASPMLWRFTVSADYASLQRVLGAAGERKLPVIVDGVSFDGASGRAGRGGARIWRIDAWL